MAIERIADPNAFIGSFSFHDVRIDRIDLDFDNQIVELKTPDLNWNYDGVEGYVERPCLLRFLGARSYLIDILDAEGVVIDSVTAKAVDGAVQADIFLSLGGGKSSWGSGQRSISFVFDALEIVDT